MHTMAKQSDVVLHGYVGDQRVETDRLGRLVTLTDVEVVDAILGTKTGEVITIYQVGGQKGGVVMPIIGGQRYVFGQQMILFGLKLDDKFVSYGAGQGKFDIVKEGKEEIVREDLGSVHAIKKGQRGDIEVYKPDPMIFPEVGELKSEIRMMLKN